MSRRSSTQSIRDDKGLEIKAIVRFRPSIDPFKTDKTDLYSYPNASTIAVKRSSENAETFTVDRIFPPATSQEEIFDVVGKPIIEDILTGYNGTVFAYGQTGSGKSYTMMGLDIYDPDTKGIIPRASNLIFSKLQESTCEIEYSLKCSIIEVYKESLRDLLSNSGVRLKIKEDPRKGVFVQGLEEVYVVCEEELMGLIALAESKRTVASTKLNQVSSRSHQLFVLEVNQKLPDDTEKRGIMNFIDLAGSEKVKESGVTGNKLEEAKKINLSLSCLGNVINALSSKADYIPYRDSKLTRLLQESLGGNYKTTLIVNCSLDPRDVEVTTSALKFAKRVKNIKNNVKLNIKKSPEAYSKIISQLRHKIESLKVENKKLLDEHENDILMKSNCLIIQSTSSPNVDEMSISPHSENDNSSVSWVGRGTTFSNLVEGYVQNDSDFFALQEENRNLSKTIKELEAEISNEIRKRIQAEIQVNQHYEMYQKLLFKQNNETNSIQYLKDENKSLKSTIEMLEYYLQKSSERMDHLLKKIASGQTITESDYSDISPAESNDTLNSLDDPYKTLISEVEETVETPFDNILKSDQSFTKALQEALVDGCQVSNETRIHQLKTQLIQSGLANCELLRIYYDVQCKCNILIEKLSSKNKFIAHLENSVKELEGCLDQMHLTNIKIVGLGRKIETVSAPQEDSVKPKFVRKMKPANTIKSNIQNFNTFNRQKSQNFDSECEDNGRFAEIQVDAFKMRNLESDLHIQTIYHQQVHQSYDILEQENQELSARLAVIQKENLSIYTLEKNHWKIYLEKFKDLCNKELARKQAEINKLNALLGKWIDMYMGLQESKGIPTSGESTKKGKRRTLSIEYMEQIKYLTEQTIISRKPRELKLAGSPLHKKFHSPIIISVTSISGDTSPPSPMDE